MNDQLFQRVIRATARFDAFDLLTAVAALQLMPTNISRTVRLELLAHAIATHTVDTSRRTRRQQRDITLSPPASPSRLMDTLPKAGFSWARLFDTKDSLIELTSRAQRRFVMAGASPRGGSFRKCPPYTTSDRSSQHVVGGRIGALMLIVMTTPGVAS